jgi:hypothetical protein
MSQRSRILDLLPFLLPLVLVLGFLWYYHVALPGSPESPNPVEISRLIWGASSLCLAMLMLLGTVVSTAIVANSLRGSLFQGMIPILYLLGGLALLAVIVVPKFQAAGLAGLSLLENISYIEGYIERTNLLGAWTVIATVAAAIAIGWRADKVAIGDLAKRVEHHRLLLTISALILASGVLEITALFRFAATASFPGQRQNVAPLADALDLGNGIALGAGLLFSLLLLLVFGPTTLRLEKRFKELASQACKAETGAAAGFSLEQWSIMHGFIGNPLENAQWVAKLILPFATGLATTLFHGYLGIK